MLWVGNGWMYGCLDETWMIMDGWFVGGWAGAFSGACRTDGNDGVVDMSTVC